MGVPLHAFASSVCQAGVLEAGGQGRPALGEREALGRGGSHAWEPGMLSAIGRVGERAGRAQRKRPEQWVFGAQGLHWPCCCNSSGDFPCQPSKPRLSPLSPSWVPLPPPLSACPPQLFMYPNMAALPFRCGHLPSSPVLLSKPSAPGNVFGNKALHLTSADLHLMTVT